MTAAGLADVGARDPHPLVLGGCLEHATEQLAVARLELVLPAQRDSRLGGALGEGVANSLELGEAGKAGASPGPRGHASIDLDPPERLRAEVCELAFQPPDLAAQLSPGKALVATYGESLIADSKTDSFCWCPSSLTQTRHPCRV